MRAGCRPRKGIFVSDVPQAKAVRSTDHQILLEVIKGVRDSLDDFVPEDAGEYYDDLKAVVDKIPDDYLTFFYPEGNFTNCKKGWYPLIISCDQALTIKYPDYKLILVGEFFGFMNYHFELPESDHELYVKMRGIVRFYASLSRATDSTTGELTA